MDRRTLVLRVLRRKRLEVARVHLSKISLLIGLMVPALQPEGKPYVDVSNSKRALLARPTSCPSAQLIPPFANMNFDDIDRIRFDDILLGDDTTLVRFQVETSLAGMRDAEENMAAVYKSARQIAEARWWELRAWQDGISEAVVANSDAMLEPMIKLAR